MSARDDRPGTPAAARAPRVPPLVVASIAATAMWGVDRWLPSWRFALPARQAVTLVLLLAAAALGIAGLRAFRNARTTSNPLHPQRASSLVTGGIYRHTRNPMYVAVAVALLAWAAWLAHALAPLGVAAFVAWIDRRQIPSEERALRALFGAEFERYCREVRRWL